VDLAAVAVLGGALGKVVTSSVDDVLTPPIGLAPPAPEDFLLPVPFESLHHFYPRVEIT